MPTQQWRAIESCLAFSREDRIESVNDFWLKFSSKRKATAKYAVAVIALMTSLATAAYQYRDAYFPQFSEQDARSEIEQQLRIEIRKESISRDRKSTRLNSSHVASSYAVFCLKKK